MKLVGTGAAAGMLLLAASATAGVVTISAPYIDTGYFLHQFSASATLSSLHFESPDSEHESYFAGNQNSTFGGGSNTDRRPYFVFDVSGVAGIAASATLRVWVWQSATANGNTGGYVSTDATETFQLRSVDSFTAAQIINAPYNDTMNHTLDVPVWTDLGDGTVLGSRVFSIADITTGLVPSPTADQSTVCGQANSPCGKWIDIALNAAALAQIEASGGNWVFGGFVSTIAPNTGGREWLFAGTLVDLDPAKMSYPDFLTPAPQLLVDTPDADDDGVADANDNCRNVANNTGLAAQCNSDGDAFGNRCDGDFISPAPGNGTTNAQDYGFFRARLGTTTTPPTYDVADINCNGTVNAQDYAVFRTLLGSPPGPGAGP